MVLDLEHLEARTIALEIMMRGLLTGLVARAADPVAEIERFSKQLQSTLDLIEMNGADQAHSESLRHSLRAIFDSNMRALRARVASAPDN